MKSLEHKRIFGLDFLRAMAISLVIASHATYILFPKSEHSIITLVRILGAIGVDLFFVLSGFLIGRILLKTILNNKVKFTDLLLFWKRRWLRTLPNYFLILILNIGLSVIFGYLIPENIASYFLFFQNVNAPHPDFFTEAWSLSIEEFAYLFLPFILYLGLFLLKKTNKGKLFFNVTLLTIALLMLLKINYYFKTDVSSYKEWSSTYRKVVIYRLDTIYLGFLMAYLAQIKTTFIKRYKIGFAVFGLVLLVVLHVLVYWFALLPQTHLWFFVFIYLNIVGLSLMLMLPYFSELNYQGIGVKFIQFISKTSYSIYLINYSIVLLTLKHYFDFINLSFVNRTAVLILFLGITLVLSTLVYRFFELPILNYRNRKFKS
jgi:peptidoglycan/LPS O-acetylase OafA/YrhL